MLVDDHRKSSGRFSNKAAIDGGFMSSNLNDKQFLIAALEKHRSNLRVLELQAIDYGTSGTPLYLINSINDEKRHISALEEKLLLYEANTNSQKYPEQRIDQRITTFSSSNKGIYIAIFSIITISLLVYFGIIFSSNPINKISGDLSQITSTILPIKTITQEINTPNPSLAMPDNSNLLSSPTIASPTIPISLNQPTSPNIPAEITPNATSTSISSTPILSVVSVGSMASSCFEPVILLKDPRSEEIRMGEDYGTQLAPSTLGSLDTDGFVKMMIILSGEDTNTKWVQIENNIKFHVEYKDIYPEQVNIVGECAGVGSYRDVNTIILNGNYSEYVTQTIVPDIDYLTLQPGESEFLRFTMKCQNLGSYIVNINIPYTYGTEKGVITERREVICPQSFTFWSFLGGPFEGGSGVWTGNSYDVSPK